MTKERCIFNKGWVQGLRCNKTALCWIQRWIQVSNKYSNVLQQNIYWVRVNARRTGVEHRLVEVKCSVQCSFPKHETDDRLYEVCMETLLWRRLFTNTVSLADDTKTVKFQFEANLSSCGENIMCKHVSRQRLLVKPIVKSCCFVPESWAILDCMWSGEQTALFVVESGSCASVVDQAVESN